MIPNLVLVAVALFGGQVLAQAEMNACAKGCVVNIFADPSRLGCKLEDKNCACHSGQNLMFGVRDCITQACGMSGAPLGEQVAAAQKYTDQECVPFTSTAPPPAPTTTTPPPPPTTAAPPKTTTTPPPPPATTTTGPAKTGATSAASTQTAPATKVNAPSGTTTQPTTPASSASSGASSGTGKISTASSSPAAGVAASTASSTSSGDSAGKAEQKSTEEGLSVAAKAGIGAGAGVVVVLVAIILCCIMMRRRRDKRKPAGPTRPTRSPEACNISRPVAGGRHYAEDVESPSSLNFPFPATTTPIVHAGEKSNAPLQSPKSPYLGSRVSHDLSIKGNRYEDMLPRTQPRTMI